MQFNKEHIETLDYLIDLDVTGSQHLVDIKNYINRLINEKTLTYENNSYWVIYTEPSKTEMSLKHWLAFNCLADDIDHAKEQCMDAYPKCSILWVKQCLNMYQAINEYQMELLNHD